MSSIQMQNAILRVHMVLVRKMDITGYAHPMDRLGPALSCFGSGAAARAAIVAEPLFGP